MAQSLGKQPGATGLGLMGFTWKPTPPPLEQTLQALRAAVENGATIWNAGEFYGTQVYNSMTIAKAYFTKYPEDADIVSLYVKGGTNLETYHPEGSPDAVRRSIDNVLAQLGGTKKVDGFACSRRNHKTPLEVTLGVIKNEYVDTGKIGGVYVSECSAETIREASKHAKIIAAELEVSMFSPDILSNDIAATCAQLGIPIIAYSPIGRGVLTGKYTKTSQFKEFGIVSIFPRVQQEALDHNLKLVRQVELLAEKKGCTPAQLAINWVRGLSGRPGIPTVVPIPGASSVDRVVENAKVIPLTDEEMKAIGDLIDSFEVAGGRYPQGIPTDT